MNVLGICDKTMQEIYYLKEISKKNIARISDAKWEIKDYDSAKEFKRKFQKNSDLDLVYLDVTMEQGIDAAKEVRKNKEDAVLLIIAEQETSPMSYLNPAIQATSLLIRPLERDEINYAIKEAWNYYEETTLKAKDCLEITGEGEENVRIPFHKIQFIESYNKKIYIYVENQKYGFYDTLGNLEGRLPEYFLRCHRSFIVNQNKIREVSLHRSEIVLHTDMTVPLARTYKAKFKKIRGENGWN